MPAPRFYVYRSTADKLNDAFERIADEGDEIVPPLYHLGSRDWLVLVRKAAAEPGDQGTVLDRQLSRAVEEGARRGVADANRRSDQRSRIGR